MEGEGGVSREGGRDEGGVTEQTGEGLGRGQGAWVGGRGLDRRVISCDALKLFLAEGVEGDGGGGGEMLGAGGEQDGLSVRVRAVNRAANDSRPLIHSQYLHRESIYLADTLFERSVADGVHIVMEKIMSSFAQVEMYVSAARRGGDATVPATAAPTGGSEADGSEAELLDGSEAELREAELQFLGGSRVGEKPAHTRQAYAGGRDGGTVGGGLQPRARYGVLILAAAADIEHSIKGNQVRRRSGHVVTHQQLIAQHRQFMRTLQQLRHDMEAGRDSLGGLGLVVVDTNGLLQALAGGAGLDEAREALVVDYMHFIRPADAGQDSKESCSSK